MKLPFLVKLSGGLLLQIFIVAVTVFVTLHFFAPKPKPAIAPVPILVTNPAQIEPAVHAALGDTTQKKPSVIQKVFGLMMPAPPTQTTIYREYTPVDSTLIARLFLMNNVSLRGNELSTTSFNQATKAMMTRSFSLTHRNWDLGTNSQGPFVNQYRQIFALDGVYLGPAYSFPDGLTARLWAEADFFEMFKLQGSVEPRKVEIAVGWKLW